MNEQQSATEQQNVNVDPLVMTPAAKGIVALFIGKDGRVITSVNDFSPGGYGGFSLPESQKIRAKRSLAYEVMRDLASPLICEAIDAYDAEKILNALCSRCGCRVEIIVVGHEA